MVYDLIIIGGSAAAAAAGIYAARRNLFFKIISKDFGGEVATSGEIGNWPGVSRTDGLALAGKFKEHLAVYKVIPEEGVEVTRIARSQDGIFCISAKGDGITKAADKLEDPMSADPVCDYSARSVIVATGVHPKKLKVPGEIEFRNKGVSYCTVCDGPLFAGRIVAVIGGGNSALESALMLADICPKVFLINIHPVFKGEQILVDNVKKKKNMEIIYEGVTTEITGKDFVTGLKYNKGGKSRELKTDGVFIHIGMVPNSGIVPDKTEKNRAGEIIVDKNCQTNIPGLFAAGDVTDVPFKQIVIAAGQGTIAALSAAQFLNKIES